MTAYAQYLAGGLAAAYLIGWLGDALMRAHARCDSWSKA